MPRPIDFDRLAFHRLVFARRRHGWWTPLAVGALGLVIYILALLLLALVGVAAALSNPDAARALEAVLADGGALDVTSPLSLVVGLGTVALMLPAYLLASLVVNGRRLGFASAVYGRLRWRWMLVCGGLAIATAVVVTLVTALLPADASAATLEAPAGATLWLSLLAVVLLVPVQATAEEYVFRGYLMQAIGRWLRHPLFAILLPVPLFVIGHLYDPVGQAAVGLFAVAAGWLTWRTGGLEAAIALHVVNNLLAFLLGLLGLSDPAATDVGWVSFASSVLLLAVYAGAVELVLRRRPIVRTYALPRAPLPPTVAMPTPTATVPLPGEPTPDLTRP
ncbi:type II CAAX endopeptidase family protein [Microbacterium sp. NM3R9]|uniref:CPBP family intramembrane glutamic endopeptidase n=1 Tax=Microbacterium thalli TaxID=3027921 RepID=UPI0023651A27|nr:type II CAAX endopeptidase family protein [Microbacterium thalli]MDD7929329.1 type II CAAX endopeptidase family protein [Microbacterium thalli]MDN8549153.1 type II CAAX endopeptidase family protein [Microbacterium thalli]